MEEIWFAINDIPMDVLSRLPVKTLLGLKCVSKDWHRLISERSFITHQLKRAEPVSGFFFQERFQWCDDDIKTISYIPVKMEGTEVQSSVFNFLPESVVLSAVSNGLICCRSCFPSPRPVIYVCNPLNKEWVTFPWSAPDKRSSLGLAFDPFKNPIDKSTDFKVVTVHQTASDMEVEDEDKDSYLTFDIYSSKTRTWHRSREKCHCHHSLFKNKGIFVGGALYWLTDGDQILMFDVQNELSWLVTVPIPLVQFDSIPEMCIGESEGKLHYVLISEGGLHVWVLEDYLDFTWELKYSIALDAMEKENTEFLCNIQQRVKSRMAVDMTPWMDPLAFKDGILFMRVAARIYLFNMETRKLEELCTLSMLGPNSIISPIVLPYSMSLIPLG
ncbi:F-box protein At5g49610-like [Actinidia eriantha]|uniref:F-box protein At5g49610-like n=1 Tax=Actinidia eriantha TaxID=165200 RepID=UPI00258961C8|nr:F-box protein At5g49610-like [Actinidia eriantha]